MIVRMYLDTSPIIFAVERVEPHFAAVVTRISQPNVSLLTCDVFRTDDHDLKRCSEIVVEVVTP